MTELLAGDVVLADTDQLTFVVVNQHRTAETRASMLTLAHEVGSLTVTPDHMLLADGVFTAARDIRVGAALTCGAVVQQIFPSQGDAINPITGAGTILAADPGGGPIVAATGNEWLADVLLSPYPKYTLSFALARLFPVAVQAYYDRALEPFFTAAAPSLAAIKAVVPTPVTAAVIALFDEMIVPQFVV